MNAAVVIVNWNGAEDTLACLRSIVDSGPELQLIVVDNGSTDGSLPRLAAGLAAAGIGSAPEARAGARVWLLAAGENLGFAAGCNHGLRVAQAAGFEWVVFLNNDTVVEGPALQRLVQRLAQGRQAGERCFATLPMITVHGTERIWNCGGVLWPLGLRRYHLAGRARAEGARQGELRCSFFTGCCVAVPVAEFAARGGFSERFFFGEEDFELALWMRDRGLHAVCLTSAVVQHKVSASFEAASGGDAASRGAGARAFVYYLNRFIHMRLRFGRWRWRLWAAAYLPYIALLLWRSGAVPRAELPRFGRRLLARASAMDGVARADFEAVMAGRW